MEMADERHTRHLQAVIEDLQNQLIALTAKVEDLQSERNEARNLVEQLAKDVLTVAFKRMPSNLWYTDRRIHRAISVLKINAMQARFLAQRELAHLKPGVDWNG